MTWTKEDLVSIIKEELDNVLSENTREQWLENNLLINMDEEVNDASSAQTQLHNFVTKSMRAKVPAGMGIAGNYMSFDSAKGYLDDINAIPTDDRKKGMEAAVEIFKSLSNFFDASGENLNKVDAISAKMLGKPTPSSSNYKEPEYKPPTRPFQDVEDDAPSKSLFSRFLGR